jgi:hypothetical protein
VSNPLRAFIIFIAACWWGPILTATIPAPPHSATEVLAMAAFMIVLVALTLAALAPWRTKP